MGARRFRRPSGGSIPPASIGYCQPVAVEEGQSADSSPRAANAAERDHPAELSSYETVNHWFDLAADRMELRDDMREVLRSSYREVQVQIPIRLADGRTTSTPATASSTTARAAPTRAASATTPRSTSTRCARSRR